MKEEGDMKVYIGDFLGVTETLSGSHAERVTAGEEPRRRVCSPNSSLECGSLYVTAGGILIIWPCGNTHVRGIRVGQAPFFFPLNS